MNLLSRDIESAEVSGAQSILVRWLHTTFSTSATVDMKGCRAGRGVYIQSDTNRNASLVLW